MNPFRTELSTSFAQTDSFGFIRHYSRYIDSYYFSIPRNDDSDYWLMSGMFSSKESLEKGILSAIQVMSKVSCYKILEKDRKFFFQLRVGQKLIAESAPMESASATIVELGKFIYWAECQNELFLSFFSPRASEAA